jgi:WD40 repeat protein
VDTATGEILSQLSIPVIQSPHISLLADGTLLATVASNNEIGVWNLINGQHQITLPANHEFPITGLSYTRSEPLVSGDSEGILRFRVAYEESGVTRLGEKIWNIFPHSDDKVLVVSDHRIQLYDVHTASPVPLCIHPETQEPLMFLSGDFAAVPMDYDGKTLVYIDQGVMYWRHEDCTTAPFRITTAPRAETYFAVKVIGDVIYTGSERGLVETRQIYTTESGVLRSTIPLVVTPHNNWVTQIAANRDGVIISAACAAIEFHLFDGSQLCSGSELRLSKEYEPLPYILTAGHIGQIEKIIIHPYGDRFITIGGDGTAVIWGHPAGN